jgi:hypothetical protein
MNPEIEIGFELKPRKSLNPTTMCCPVLSTAIEVSDCVDAIRRRTFILAFRLIHAGTGLLEVSCRCDAGQTLCNRRPRAGGGVTRRRHPIVGVLRPSLSIGGAEGHPGPRGDRCRNYGA